MVGNLFITPSGSFDEGMLKIGWAQQAARIYLNGGLNPGTFIGYPVLKILVRHTAAEAESWISCLEQRSEKVRGIPANVLDWLVDEAETHEALGALIEGYTVKPAPELSSFTFRTRRQDAPPHETLVPLNLS